MRMFDATGCVAFLAAVLLVAPSSGLGESGAFATSAEPQSCATAEYHQFDFWIGDWDTYDADKLHTKIARLHVDRILDGCVIREDYDQNDGHHGQSFNIYDSARKVWHQTWVTNRGELLVIEGQFENGAMVLTGTDERRHVQVRGTWKPVSDGVRETAVTSADGKRWAPLFDIIFRAHKD